MRMRKSIAVALVGALGAQPAWAGLRDWLGSLTESGKSTTSSSVTASALTSEETVRGLKEALSKGMRYAVDALGKPDGFLSRAEVRIPIPQPMRQTTKLLRKLGQDKYADEFVATMNHAAEKAVTEAGPIFADAIREMTVDDAIKILRGPQDGRCDLRLQAHGGPSRSGAKPAGPRHGGHRRLHHWQDPRRIVPHDGQGGTEYSRESRGPYHGPVEEGVRCREPLSGVIRHAHASRFIAYGRTAA
jgi:hypothetical protein